MTTPAPPLRAVLALVVGALTCSLAACGDGNLSSPDDLLAYPAPDVEPLPCIPNLDGVIEAHELAPTLNQLASYRVTPPLPNASQDGFPVDLYGTVDDDGRRIWDWSAPSPSDRVAKLHAEPLTDQWFAPEFSTGGFALPTDAAGTLMGVYSHDVDGMLLHGVASTEEDPDDGKTLLVYREPVLFFPFPMTVGDHWTQTGEVRDGWLRGLSPWSQDDIYEVSVEEAGELRLPDFTFTQALRIHTRVETRPKAGTDQGYVQHQHSFVFECFGEVARATSPVVLVPADDPGPDFSTAHEIRRLGWF